MERKIILTKDGSHTVELPDLNVTYHSRHGAVQESLHVFIRAGLYEALQRFPDALSLLEMGFGTGLNAYLTALEAEQYNRPVHYTSIEQFPLPLEEAALLNYADTDGQKALFLQLHTASWNEDTPLTDHFTLHKQSISLSGFRPARLFHLIYYDAFAPSAQPELWTREVFGQLYQALHPGGLLVTYCSKGDVRRALQAAGFSVTKIPGPPGKREMVRAERIV